MQTWDDNMEEDCLKPGFVKFWTSNFCEYCKLCSEHEMEAQ